MDIKFSKDSGETPQQEAPGEKKSQSALLLLLLLILIGGFTYLYFFTALIKPQEVQKNAEAPAPPAQIVKMPLPPRVGEPAKPDEKAAGQTAVPITATTTPVIAVAPATKPSAAPVKPAPAKPKEEPKKAETVKPTDKKPQPVPVESKKSTTAKNGKRKQASGGQAKPKSVVITKRTEAESWSLIVGNYVLEEALSADMGRVRKAGFEPVVKPSALKKTTMNRLFVSEFNDRVAAQSTLEKLKRLTSDAFVIEQGGRFTLYAGSYLQNESANSEKERLKAAGFTATVKHADIAIPSRSLSVGPFNSKKAADAALGRLRVAGIKATLSQK
jgi:cell division septation protein DedD